VAPTGDTLYLLNCTGCYVYNSTLRQGRYSLNLASVDYLIFNTTAANAYGGAIIFNNGASSSPEESNGNLIRVSADQSNPGGCSNPSSTPAWAASHAYSTCAAVALPGTTNFYLQATAGGTSGSTTPVAASYGTNITDGSVTWQTMSPKGASNGALGSCAFQFDTDSYITFIYDSDFSGAEYNGICTSNSSSGVGPQDLYINGADTAALQNGVILTAGNGIFISNSNIGTCSVTGNGCAGINFEGAPGGDANINGNKIYQTAIGVLIQAGSTILINSNNIYGNSSAGIDVATGTDRFLINGNVMYSAQYGGNGGTNTEVVSSGTAYCAIQSNIAGTGTYGGQNGAPCPGDNNQ
jgi:hypothetical protein